MLLHSECVIVLNDWKGARKYYQGCFQVIATAVRYCEHRNRRIAPRGWPYSQQSYFWRCEWGHEAFAAVWYQRGALALVSKQSLKFLSLRVQTNRVHPRKSPASGKAMGLFPVHDKRATRVVPQTWLLYEANCLARAQRIYAQVGRLGLRRGLWLRAGECLDKTRHRRPGAGAAVLGDNRGFIIILNMH